MLCRGAIHIIIGCDPSHSKGFDFAIPTPPNDDTRQLHSPTLATTSLQKYEHIHCATPAEIVGKYVVCCDLSNSTGPHRGDVVSLASGLSFNKQEDQGIPRTVIRPSECGWWLMDFQKQKETRAKAMYALFATPPKKRSTPYIAITCTLAIWGWLKLLHTAHFFSHSHHKRHDAVENCTHRPTHTRAAGRDGMCDAMLHAPLIPPPPRQQAAQPRRAPLLGFRTPPQAPTEVHVPEEPFGHVPPCRLPTARPPRSFRLRSLVSPRLAPHRGRS